MKRQHKQQNMPRLMDAPFFSYWQALYMAFYSRRLYVDVGTRWKGICFFYLLLMMVVATIPLTVRLMYEYNQFVHVQLIEPFSRIPPLTLRHGVISLNEPMPYFVKSKTGAVVAMIDTRTNGVGMQGTFPELMLLITRDKIYFRPPVINFLPGLTQAPDSHEPIVKEPDRRLSQVLLIDDWIHSNAILPMVWIMAGLIYPFVFSFFFGLFFSFFLIIAMLAQVYSWLILRFKIKFTDALRLLIVSSTAQLSVLLLCLSAHWIFPGLGLICLSLCVVYFSYAVLSVKRERSRLVRV